MGWISKGGDLKDVWATRNVTGTDRLFKLSFSVMALVEWSQGLYALKSKLTF